jgi:beta-galactosidase
MFFGILSVYAQTNNPNVSLINDREHLLMDFGWRFALDNASGYAKDFLGGTGYFTYFAKTGYDDGVASQ